jgi:hypothetical protein
MIEDDTFPIIVRRNTILPQYSIRAIALAARGTGQIRCLKAQNFFLQPFRSQQIWPLF